jgi:hypothetical protein
MFYSTNQKSSVAISIAKPIPRPDRLLSNDRCFGEAEYALQLPKAGLIQVRHVPAWTLAEIAHSL